MARTANWWATPMSGQPYRSGGLAARSTHKSNGNHLTNTPDPSTLYNTYKGWIQGVLGDSSFSPVTNGFSPTANDSIWFLANYKNKTSNPGLVTGNHCQDVLCPSVTWSTRYKNWWLLEKVKNYRNAFAPLLRTRKHIYEQANGHALNSQNNSWVPFQYIAKDDVAQFTSSQYTNSGMFDDTINKIMIDAHSGDGSILYHEYLHTLQAADYSDIGIWTNEGILELIVRTISEDLSGVTYKGQPSYNLMTGAAAKIMADLDAAGKNGLKTLVKVFCDPVTRGNVNSTLQSKLNSLSTAMVSVSPTQLTGYALPTNIVTIIGEIVTEMVSTIAV